METSLVGSYPQPEWLVDREKLRGRLPPRVRASDIWKIDPDQLANAQDAATLAAIRDQERAGLDIVTDGEIRRESYSNYFVLALDGIDVDQPGTALDRNGNPMPVPRVAGPITRRGGSILKRDAEFLRGATDRKIKVTVPGPFTMAQQAQNDHYKTDEEVAFAFADVVRQEVTELFEAGVDIVQLDEPWMESRADQARAFGIETLNRALDGVTGTTVLHICFGYPLFVPGHKRTYRFLAELADAPVDQISIETAQAELDLEVLERLGDKTIVLGVIALDSDEVESANTVKQRIERALPYTKNLVAAPDCGMKYLSREAAFGKLQSLVEGAKLASV
ncbi:cobalamin-independent methionine synthase II family protein [Solirubrobacter taibaiensis]|nr:cobalamin-independent methionine synthase II family protein [Solirubrobacter taibaiensis]